MKQILLLVALAALCGCAARPAAMPTIPTSQPGVFFSDQGAILPQEELLSRLRAADVVLVGESHTNLCDHAVQAALVELGEGSAIGLEMLPVTAQPILDQFYQGAVSPEEFGQAVGWNMLWGHPYDRYLPIFQLARKFELPVVALNTPRGVLDKFCANASLSSDERALLPSHVEPVSPQQRQTLEELFQMHQSMGGQSANLMRERFFLAQAVWDSMMAEQALLWREKLGRPLLILAGSGHVEHGWGIAYRLHLLAPQARCLSFLPVRDQEDFEEQTRADMRPFPENDTLFFYCPTQHKNRLGMNLTEDKGRVIVAGVDANSQAEQAGLREGDELLRAGDRTLEGAADLHFAAMDAMRKEQPLTLTIVRDGQQQTLTLQLR